MPVDFEAFAISCLAVVAPATVIFPPVANSFIITAVGPSVLLNSILPLSEVNVLVPVLPSVAAPVYV